MTREATRHLTAWLAQQLQRFDDANEKRRQLWIDIFEQVDDDKNEVLDVDEFVEVCLALTTAESLWGELMHERTLLP